MSWEHVQTLRTGADGAAEVRGLRPGDYCAFLATVPAPYSSWRNAGAASTALAHYAKPLSLAGAAPRAQIDFVVGAGSELAGRFAMSDGSAPPQRHGVTVDFTSSPQVGGFRGDMTFMVRPTQMSDERFAVAGLSANERYTIREFDADHLKPIVIVGLRMNGTTLRGDDIVVPPSGARPLLEVVLDRAGVVSGTVPGVTAGRTAARRVSGDAPAALYPDTAWAEIADGRFVFRGLPPGEYVVSIEGGAAGQRVRVEPGALIELAF
ncbi:MAG TPA: hypothetical protein VL309_00960 [Vicinamibacterales bacterium]|nr:hypothetical protein [Vicinamibacterales bacterium]